jgi:hypothetical protein
MNARRLSRGQASTVIRVAAALTLALAAGACGNGKTAPHPKEKSDLYLITSLPLLFGEQFGLDFAKPDITRALDERFNLKAVDLPSQVPDGEALLVAQPRALPAEELVRLDRWVRSGGRLVLFADPLLEWPSKRPLGDPLRPPPMFPDTGLLFHWGLRLDAPQQRGLVRDRDDAGEVMYQSPGSLVKVGGTCRVEPNAIVATCDLGRGQAVIVADADWLDMPRIDGLAGKHIPADVRLVSFLELFLARP